MNFPLLDERKLKQNGMDFPTSLFEYTNCIFEPRLDLSV